MFQHYLDRSSDKEPQGWRGKLRALGERVDWEDVYVFVHLTLAAMFIIWGLEIIFPWSIWRVLVGLYIGVWVGFDLIKELWGKGIYLLIEEEPSPDE